MRWLAAALECGSLPPLWGGRGGGGEMRNLTAAPLPPQSGSKLPHSKAVASHRTSKLASPNIRLIGRGEWISRSLTQSWRSLPKRVPGWPPTCRRRGGAITAGRAPTIPLWREIARDWQRMLYEGGWIAISWPREHGGRGATVIERWLFEEELDRAGAPYPPGSANVDMIGSGNPASRHGRATERFLNRLLSGDDLVVPGLLRTRRRLRPRRPALPRRAARRRVRGQWPEGVDQPCRGGRLVLPPLPHGNGSAQAQGHQPAAGRHEDAGHHASRRSSR